MSDLELTDLDSATRARRIEEFFEDDPRDFSGFRADQNRVPIAESSSDESDQGSYRPLRLPRRRVAIDVDLKENKLYKNHKHSFDIMKRKLDSKLDSIKTHYELQPQTEENIETLIEHKAHLESQKALLSTKTNKLVETQTRLEGESQFDNFEQLEQLHTETSTKINVWIGKLNKIISQHQKDKDIAHRERLGLPKFDGDILNFEQWKTQFLTFCNGLGNQEKCMHLKNALGEKPYSEVKRLFLRNRDFEVIWKALKDHYEDARMLIDVTISTFLNIPRPGKSLKEISKHFFSMRNEASNVINLNLTQEQLLTHIYLLQIPGSVRTELHNNLDKDLHKFTFDDIAGAVSALNTATSWQLNQTTDETQGAQACALVVSPTDELTAIPGLVRTDKALSAGPKPETNDNNSSHRGKGRGFGRGGRGRGGGQSQDRLKNMKCYICNGEGHRAHGCTQYNYGPEMRCRLQELGRCDACLISEKDHTSSCRSEKSICNNCGGLGHLTITCDGRTHPGSWILKTYAKK